MTRKQISKYLPLMQAFADGKTIQYWSKYHNEWKDVVAPAFNMNNKYRIKPEPREFWVRKCEETITHCYFFLEDHLALSKDAPRKLCEHCIVARAVEILNTANPQ